MAKQNKGLGRGLNSLLGGSAEEASPAQETKERVSVEKKPAEKAAPKRATTSIDNRETIVSENDAESAKVVSRAAKETKPEVREETKASDRIKEDDNVTIKGVVERKPDEVPLNSVKPNPDQPRTNFKAEELEELAASIERDGLLQPILVRQIGKEYQIIAGERRWQACRSLGLTTIPVRIKDANDDKALELALIENIQRSDLNPIEEAYGYRRLMDRRGYTQSEVAEVVSKGRSTVANALRLLELPEAAQQMLFEDKISAGHARAILAIPSKEGKQKLTDKLVEEKLSVREAEMYARLFMGNKGTDDKSARVPTPLVFKQIARALRDSLETNVRVKTVKGKNKIEIEFGDEDELEQLFEKLTAFQEQN